MSDPFWPGIAVLVAYVAAAVALGVVSNRLKRWVTLLGSLFVICLGVIGTLWPNPGWHEGGSNKIDALTSAFVWYWLPFTVSYVIAFVLGRYVARLVLRRREG